MPERTYKLIELVGISEKSMEDAIQNAVSRASETLKGIDWIEVTQTRGLIKDGKVTEWQVVAKLGFRVMGHDELKGA